MKICTLCKIELPLSAFSADYRRSDKLQSRCNKCRSSDNSERKQRYKESGLCQWCASPNDRPNRASCSKCAERSSANKLELKLKTFAIYGGVICACCGETDHRFLTLDHINNDGAEHRKQVYSNIYRWLKAKKYPEGFQVLCWNCNLGKYHNKGICPHQLTRVIQM